MNFIKLYKHLLPRALAWRLPKAIAAGFQRFLRKYLEGLSEFPVDIKDFSDQIFLDAFPETTREIKKWEQQFNIESAGTETDRRNGIIARWRAQGGQGKDYLEDIIHSAGFTNVFIHEWWTDLGGGEFDTKDPNEYLSSDSLLVNKGPTTAITIYQSYCGGLDSDCGSPLAECGALLEIRFQDFEYEVPTEEDDFRFIVYVGAEIFPDHAEIDSLKRTEFERLLLTYFPDQQWIGLLIDYI